MKTPPQRIARKFFLIVVMCAIICGIYLIADTLDNKTYANYVYPNIEIIFSSTNEKEDLAVFYDNNKADCFDDQHLETYKILASDELQRAVIPIPKENMNCIRIDWGTSAGMTQIESITISKNMFLRKKITGEDILTIFSMSNMLTEYAMDDASKLVTIKYDDTDPYVAAFNLNALKYDLFVWDGLEVFIKILVICFGFFGGVYFLFTAIVKYKKSLINMCKCQWKRIVLFMGTFMGIFFLFVGNDKLNYNKLLNYPTIEILFTSTNAEEDLIIFYDNGKENFFDENHMDICKIIPTKGYQKAVFSIPQGSLNKLRIDWGVSFGKTMLKSIVVKKDLFHKVELKGEDIIHTFSRTNMLTRYEVDENSGFVRLEYTGADPSIVALQADLLTYDLCIGEGLKSLFKLIFICFAISSLVYFFIVNIYKQKKLIANKFIKIAQDKNVQRCVGGGMLLIIFLIFVSVPVYFTVDSAWYLSYFNFFDGNKSFFSWDLIRGWLFPLLLYITSVCFGFTSQGIICLMLIAYAVTLILCFGLFRLLGKDKFVYVKYIVIFVIIFNPIVFGYYHVLLTEFLGATLCLFNLYYWVKSCYQNTQKNTNAYNLIMLSMNLIFAYSLKQTYIGFILLPYIITEIIKTIKTKKVKKSLMSFGTLCFAMIMLLVSIRMWSNFVQTGNALKEPQQNTTNANSSTNAFSASMIKGMTYFEKIDQNTVAILNDEMQQISTFEYASKNKSFINYIGKCFLNAPERVITGYIDNYLVLTNFYGRGADRKSAVKEPSFVRGNENSFIACAFGWYTRGHYFFEDQGYATLKEKFDFADLEQMNFPVDSSSVTEIIYGSKWYIQSSKMLYTVALTSAPFIFFIMLVHAIICFFMKKCICKEEEICFILETTVFGYVMMLAVLNNQIDRYCFPIFILAILGLFLFIYLTGKNIKERIKVKNKRKVSIT